MGRSFIAIGTLPGTSTSFATRGSREHRREGEVSRFDLPGGSGYGFRLVARAIATDASVTVPAGTFDGCQLVDTTIVPRSELLACRESGWR